jgi:succinate dehydrogenase / fumarate reductase cytochrome b subunit
MSNVIQTSIIRKIAMAVSGLFLIIFLLQHFIINITSVFSESVFNQFSHFMGSNFVVQFIAQPILIFGVIFHFVMGFVLDFQNRSSRKVKYVKYKGSSNASWMSRNMIISGAVVLSFLILHFYDFWIPEMNYKYVEFLPEDPNRYYTELSHKFEDLVFLSLHLLHGFSSAFQSMGINNKYNYLVNFFTNLYALGIPFGFSFIAIFHYLNN